MLKRILIPLDPSPYAQAALNWGCYAAKITGAQITGLAVLDLPGIEKSVGSVPVGGIHYALHLVEKKEQEALEHIQVLLDNFKQKCEEAGVEYKLAERQGSPSTQIIHDSIYYDLVVLGLRTCYHFECIHKQGESAEHIMDHTITPILVVPDRFEEPTGELDALIAFDGSPPSARAMQRFAQLVRTAEFKVTILMSHADMDFAKQELNQAEDYLRAHDFNKIETVWTPQNIVDEIRKNYLDDTNLIVLGAHSKKGLADFMVGSLSKSMIRQENKYLLIGL